MLRPRYELCSSIRLWVESPPLVQPYKNHKCESRVKVWPSSIIGLGLGLFARKDIKYKQVVCMYSGTKWVKGKGSRYMVQGYWRNPETGCTETWYLDAASLQSAVGRWANDACDYDGVDQCFRTGRVNNIAFRLTIKNKKHPVYKQWCLEMYALEDISAGSELFVRYGVEFWSNFIINMS